MRTKILLDEADLPTHWYNVTGASAQGRTLTGTAN